MSDKITSEYLGQFWLPIKSAPTDGTNILVWWPPLHPY